VSRTVLFDIDGTLLLLRGLGRDAMERAIEEVWGIPHALRGVFFGGATDGGVAGRVAPGRARRPMWDRYVEIFQRMLASRDGEFAPLPGVVALLDALESKGARLGLLTGNIRVSALAKLGAVGLERRFDLSLSSFAEDGDRREEIAEAARRRCGDGPLTLVGDAVADVTCAKHVGARVLAVTTGLHTRDDLAAAQPDLLVDDLSETDALCAWLLSQP
jgi:phosphoglycolate phosphatase